MKKLLFVMTLGLAIIVSSCSKDQAAVRKLDGTWNATKVSSTSIFGTFDLIALGGKMSMTFTKCKLKADEWCSCTTSTTDPGESTADVTQSVYRVTGDGATLESKEHKDSTEISTITIIELTKDKVVLKETGTGYTTDIEMSKAD